MEEISFPAIVNSNVALLISIMAQLEQTQWWEEKKILAHQFKQLNILLKYSYQNVPFYQKRLSKISIDFSKKITPAIWENIPILKREDIQKYQEELYSKSLPKSHGKPSEFKTSGSTGKPIFGYKTDINGLFWQSFYFRSNSWHQVNYTGKISAIKEAKKGVADYPLGQVGNSWGYPSNLLYKTGKTSLLNINTSIPNQVEWLIKQNPNYLITFASNALALG